MAVRMWRFPDSWDYHRQGGYLVAAASREEAIAILEAEHARTAALLAAWEAEADAYPCRRVPLTVAMLRSAEWRAWVEWSTAHPRPDLIGLPDGYRENIEEVGPVYTEAGCDD